MNQVELILIAATAVMACAWIVSRLLRTRPAVQDLLWRSALIAVALSPVLVVIRESLVERQWSIPILPATVSMVPSHQPVISETLNPANALPEVTENLTRNRNVRHKNPIGPSRIAVGKSVLNQEPADSQMPIEQSDPVAATAEVVPLAPLMTEPRGATAGLTSRWPLWFELYFAFWGLGSGVHAVRIAIAAWNASQIMANAQRVKEPVFVELMAWCSNFVGLRTRANLTTSERVGGPIVVGLLRPMIVVPPVLLADESRRELKAALLHECGHLRRHDIAFDLLLMLVTAALWWHPLVYVMAIELRRLREEICDNYVLAEEPAVSYAEMLLRLSVGKRLSGSLLIGLGIFARPHRLEHRVDSLLAPSRSLETKASRATRWIVLGATCFAIFGSILVRFDRADAIAADVGDEKLPASEVPVESKPGDPTGRPVEVIASKTVADAPKAKKRTKTKNTGSRVEKVRIVNNAGKPVVGATVTAVGYRSAMSIGFNEKDWITVVTDDYGVATITFNEELARSMKSLAEFAKSNRRMGTTYEHVSVMVDHPEYPKWDGEYRVGDCPDLELSDPTTLVVRARRMNEEVPATRLVPRLSNESAYDWSEVNGVLTYRRVDVSGKNPSRWLRIVQVPDAGPMWFSDVIDLKHLPGNPISLDVVLKPGVRVEGRLADQVPRPIKNGRVLAVVVNGESEGSDKIRWNVKADIAEDGTFAIDSVPSNDNLQIIALCDGWVSHSPTEAEATAYTTQYGFPRGKYAGSQSGRPVAQLHRMREEVVIRPVIEMEPTATCVVTTIDAAGRPVPGITVDFYTSQYFRGCGVRGLGVGYDDATFVRTQLEWVGSGHSKDFRQRVVVSVVGLSV